MTTISFCDQFTEEQWQKQNGVDIDNETLKRLVSDTVAVLVSEDRPKYVDIKGKIIQYNNNEYRVFVTFSDAVPMNS